MIVDMSNCVSVCLSFPSSKNPSCGKEAQEMQDQPALDAVLSPVNLTPGKNHGAVVIAIVDDGVRISHQELAGFIWQNPREIPANQAGLRLCL